MAGFFCCYCGADETNPCDCFSKKDEQVSEPTGPKTWGDVIHFREETDKCFGYHALNLSMLCHDRAVAVVAHDVATYGIQITAKRSGVDPDHVRIALRWLLADRPPLTDPIPPETPEPVAKVVRWEPTSKDADRFEVDLATWESAFDDRRIFREVFSDTIRDCQRDLPEVEPPTPPTDRIDALEARIAEIESRATPTPVTLPSPTDGWQTEPPAVDCPCWVATNGGGIIAAKWVASESRAICSMYAYWKPIEITRYYPCPKPPPHIGKATYNTPTSFEQALTVEPPAAPEPEIPLPDGCTEVEGFPLLCRDEAGNKRTREARWLFMPWARNERDDMECEGISDATIKEAARYAINQIARDAGLDVVVK